MIVSDHYQKQVGLYDTQYNLKIKTDILPTPSIIRNNQFWGFQRIYRLQMQKISAEAIVPFIVESILLAKGGVFVLCTSYKMLQTLYQHCHFRLGNEYALFRQGQMGRDQLLERLSKHPIRFYSVQILWEGVSVVGDDLKMIIIPKLPFRVPTEPVQEARYERIQANGRNPFKEYALPQAALRLRQGVGRLIRTRRDRGTVLLLIKECGQCIMGVIS